MTGPSLVSFIRIADIIMIGENIIIPTIDPMMSIKRFIAALSVFVSGT